MNKLCNDLKYSIFSFFQWNEAYSLCEIFIIPINMKACLREQKNVKFPLIKEICNMRAKEYVEMVKFLHYISYKVENVCLMWASINGHINIVKFLISIGEKIHENVIVYSLNANSMNVIHYYEEKNIIGYNEFTKSVAIHCCGYNSGGSLIGLGYLHKKYDITRMLTHYDIILMIQIVCQLGWIDMLKFLYYNVSFKLEDIKLYGIPEAESITKGNRWHIDIRRCKELLKFIDTLE